MYDDSMSTTLWVIYIIVLIFMIITMWKIFVKAGKPGWGCIIPIYNIYLLVTIAGKPGWWLLLFFVPVVNLIISIIVSLEIAKKFGKSTGFGIGLILLGIIFYPILAFGNAKYKK